RLATPVPALAERDKNVRGVCRACKRLRKCLVEPLEIGTLHIGDAVATPRGFEAVVEGDDSCEMFRKRGVAAPLAEHVSLTVCERAGHEQARRRRDRQHGRVWNARPEQHDALLGQLGHDWIVLGKSRSFVRTAVLEGILEQPEMRLELEYFGGT